MMALADLDEILIRATYSTDMVSASIAGVSMETAVPTYSSLPRALEVEECRCPPGYRGLSCQVRWPLADPHPLAWGLAAVPLWGRGPGRLYCRVTLCLFPAGLCCWLHSHRGWPVPGALRAV